MPFTFKKLELSGLVLIQPQIFNDERGFFAETFKESEFLKQGINLSFKQDDLTLSKKNVLRGLHYQVGPKAQGQMVQVIKGKIWDVAVDIREKSPTFKQWVSVELNEENHCGLYMPPGIAHGFVVLSEEACLYYKCSAEYDPSVERGIRWDDPELAIEWPIIDPIVSGKDAALPLLKDAEVFHA